MDREGEHMDTQKILTYLRNLSENNNREWYHAHKAENKEANTQFEELIQTLILRIGEFDTLNLVFTIHYGNYF